MAKKKIENNNEAAKSIAFETLNNKQLAEAFETDLEKGLTSEQAVEQYAFLQKKKFYFKQM